MEETTRTYTKRTRNTQKSLKSTKSTQNDSKTSENYQKPSKTSQNHQNPLKNHQNPSISRVRSSSQTRIRSPRLSIQPPETIKNHENRALSGVEGRIMLTQAKKRNHLNIPGETSRESRGSYQDSLQTTQKPPLRAQKSSKSRVDLKNRHLGVSPRSIKMTIPFSSIY